MASLEAGCVVDLEAREWKFWGTFVPPRRRTQNIPGYKKTSSSLHPGSKQQQQQMEMWCASQPFQTPTFSNKQDTARLCLGPQLASELALAQKCALSGSVLGQTRAKKTARECCWSPDTERKPAVYSQTFHTESLYASCPLQVGMLLFSKKAKFWCQEVWCWITLTLAAISVVCSQSAGAPSIWSPQTAGGYWVPAKCPERIDMCRQYKIHGVLQRLPAKVRMQDTL